MHEDIFPGKGACVKSHIPDLPYEVEVVRHDPECSVVDGGSCYTPWCRCCCHGTVPKSAPMGELGGHLGSHVWKNGAELVWECADECPNLTHEGQP